MKKQVIEKFLQESIEKRDDVCFWMREENPSVEELKEYRKGVSDPLGMVTLDNALDWYLVRDFIRLLLHKENSDHLQTANCYADLVALLNRVASVYHEEGVLRFPSDEEIEEAAKSEKGGIYDTMVNVLKACDENTVLRLLKRRLTYFMECAEEYKSKRDSWLGDL